MRGLVLSASVLCALVLVACGPSGRNGTGDDDDDGTTCHPGDVGACYDGPDGTKGVGQCKEGQHVCGSDGTWGDCTGETLPVQEDCQNGVDDNCNGMTDEDIDADGDGYTSCGGDCCDSTECGTPALVNPGAFDVAGNMVDDDCDGVVDNPPALCDSALTSNTTDPMDYAKAIDICQTATMADKKWGVISATWTYADGTGVPASKAHSIRLKYGANVMPKGGTSLAIIATGAAAGVGDANPAYDDLQQGAGNGGSSNFPADFYAANGNVLPNSPGCPGPSGETANDPVMLTLKIRVPTNALSFSIDSNFFSSEFPEWVCSPYNDFFVILLDSMYAGTPANPTDKNLAFYQPMGSSMKYPVGVNLAYSGTGLFTQCVNGTTGCLSSIAGGMSGTIATCTSTLDLVGTGLDTPDPEDCDSNSFEGGGTGWLETTGNVQPGEIMTLRIALWNTSDDALQSLAVFDNFKWSVQASDPGTVIFREHGQTSPVAPRAGANASYLK